MGVGGDDGDDAFGGTAFSSRLQAKVHAASCARWRRGLPGRVEPSDPCGRRRSTASRPTQPAPDQRSQELGRRRSRPQHAAESSYPGPRGPWSLTAKRSPVRDDAPGRAPSHRLRRAKIGPSALQRSDQGSRFDTYRRSNSHSLKTWLLETPDMPMACTQVVDRAGRHALDVGLLDHRSHRLLGHRHLHTNGMRKLLRCCWL